MNTPQIDRPHLRVPRYQVSLRSPQKRRVTCTNSAQEAVCAFLCTGPLTEGSDLYIRDHLKNEVVAKIEWTEEPTLFGTPLRVRTNHFYDESLADIARHLCEHAEIRHAIVQGIAI